MAVFSKPTLVTETCYEIGHCWTPYCTEASFSVGRGIFTEALKIYGTFYIVAAFLKRKRLRHYVERVIPETLRSTIFLTINGTLFMAMFCLWRKLLGGVTYVSTAIVPSFIGSLAAILYERKSRRGPLAVYLTNLAVETIFRMLVERKLVTPIAHGEVYIFSTVAAVYLYLLRKPDGLPSSAKSLFSFFLGKDEIPKEIKSSEETGNAVTDEDVSSKDNVESSSADQSSSPANNNSGNIGSSSSSHNKQSDSSQNPSSSSLLSSSSTPPPAKPSSRSSNPLSLHAVSKCLTSVPVIRCCLGMIKGMQSWLESLPSHSSCCHQHSCLSYISKGGLTMFAFGYSVQAVISTLSNLTSILRRPSTLAKCLVSKTNLSLAAFLASFNAVFRAVNCLLRWIRNKDEEIHGLIAGALAGLSLRFYKSVTIALFAATKLFEILYFKGIKTHGLPYLPNADILIYAISTSFIFHAAVMEPHTLRPGYWKFLLRVTKNKFAVMNRRLLDVFGVNSSKLYPNYWPSYDPKFSSLLSPPVAKLP